MPSTTTYTRVKIEADRKLSADPRRHLIWGIPLFLTIVFTAFKAPSPLPSLAVLATIIGVVVYTMPGRRVKQYDAAHAAWTSLLERSSPNTVLDVHFPLQDNERVFYSEPSVRYEERRTGQVIDTQSRTKNAVGSAVVGGLLFGPAGMIVGGSMARRRTTGTATDVYNVVAVDHGSLAVTSDRVVFLGSRDTIDVAASKVMRFSAVEGTDRVNLEYAGRAPGESYTVNPALFNLSMVRRGKDRRFKIPLPPPPLAPDVNEPIALDGSDEQKALEA